MQLTIVDVKSGSPTKILMYDRFIQLSILGWGSHKVWIVTGGETDAAE